MRWFRLASVCGAVITMAAATAGAASAQGHPGAGGTSAPGAGGSAGSYELTTTDDGTSYAPTFTGNGWLGVRVPAAGQGYAGGTVPAQSELAGFYAVPSNPTSVSDTVQQRANIPTWSTLTFSDGGQAFSSAAGQTTGWRQSINLHTGVISTSETWQAPDGHITGLRYQVLTDRADEHVGLVRLQLTPQWSGTATVTDEIDGSPATLTDASGTGFDATARQDYVAVTTQGTGIQAAIASTLRSSANVTGTTTEVDADQPQTVGQQLSFPVTAGRTYTFTKYVGVDDSQNTGDPVAAAKAESSAAAGTGYQTLRHTSDSAWAALWKGRIDVLGDPTVATDVNASEFYLWSNTRAGVDWSISPAGLSSNGYDGHIFWDAETWMYPSLLAQHPDLAAGMNAYRFQRLSEAQQHAVATGYQGARFPWESALDGTEQIPPPVSINSEGVYEMHITADIALAQWQYYLATGDRSWLAGDGWPVISGAAAFWASKATQSADGAYHIDNVTGPDEENPDVNDEVYTNVAAKTTLQDAVEAAAALGRPAPPSWSQIAAGLVVPTSTMDGVQIHPEFSGYQDQLVKQADVTLLQYPWLYPMPASTATNDIDFYVPRTDPGGPSMSDAVNSIDTSALGTPGCSSFVYTERSYQPFIRDVFDQFSETKTGGAFTFMTGIGGFLQEFLYGYSGLRWQADDVQLAPSLTSQLRGVILHNLSWRGRTFDVSVGPRTTTVTVTSGPSLPVSTPSGTRTVASGHALTLSTARPDLTATDDAVRCQDATDSSEQPGAPALAAVDGSPATDWQPASLPATLTVRTHAGTGTISHAVVTWGQQWPPAPGPNIPPPPTPVTTLRASSYQLQVSTNGTSWQTVGTVNGETTRTTDELRFAPVRARWIRLSISSATANSMPLLQELTVGG
jgi:trehalose/maltose hydrolase-like predicted phosphorylase